MNELMLILKIIGSGALTHLWIVSEPTRVFRELIGFGDENYPQMNKYKKAIWRMWTCHMCIGFWIGFAFTGNFFHAAIVSIIATLIEKITRPTL